MLRRQTYGSDRPERLPFRISESRLVRYFWVPVVIIWANRDKLLNMKRIALILLLFATPVAAQEEEQGRDLMGEALKLFMRGLMAEMEPAMEGMEGLLEDLSAYHPPEILPNGDIIIRRKVPVDRGPDPERGEIDL